MDSNKDSYTGSLFKDSMLADVVTHCLTSDCKDCTGSYINEILGHKWVCGCFCHRNDNNNLVKTQALTSQAKMMA